MKAKKQKLSNGAEEKDLKIVKKSVKDLVKKMGFSGKVELKEESQNGRENLIFNIEVKDDSNFLIGQRGVNLQALQHIARLIVRRKTDSGIKFMLDVNSYRRQRNELVAKQARSAAQQAVEEKKAVIMPPMSAYERRIAHIELADNEQVSTDSIGEGENRKVIVKPTSI